MKLTSLSTLRNFILNTLQFGDKTADKRSMNVNALSNNNYLESILSTALQGTGLSTSNNASSSASVNASTLTATSDSSQFRPSRT